MSEGLGSGSARLPDSVQMLEVILGTGVLASGSVGELSHKAGLQVREQPGWQQKGGPGLSPHVVPVGTYQPAGAQVRLLQLLPLDAWAPALGAGVGQASPAQLPHLDVS